MDWEVAIREYTAVLPGSVPYENRRPVRVPQAFDTWQAAAFLTARCPFLSEAAWQEALDGGRIERRGVRLGADATVRAGDVLVHVCPDTVEPPVNTALRVIFEDEHLLAVDKPAPLPVHPSGRYNKNTLTSLLAAVCPDVSLRLVHRLDMETTGCLVLARSREAGNSLREQFEGRRVEKTYLARVFPAPGEDSFVSRRSVGRDTCEGGTRRLRASGLEALTEFTTLERFRDGSALLRVRPRTGRTHQIRLHLAGLGCPVLGERRYAKITGDADDGPLCLHAASLEFLHPTTRARMTLEAESPSWARDATIATVGGSDVNTSS